MYSKICQRSKSPDKSNLKETVTQKDIDEIRVRLEKVEDNLAQRKKRVIRYHVFKEEVKDEEHKVLA